MSTGPRFLTLSEVARLHALQLARYGGLTGVRDWGLVESAARMPEQSFGGAYLHDFPFEMAAAYAFHLAENQPFVDGNKRTAAQAAIVFLDLNGWLVPDPEGRIYDAMIAVSAHRLDKNGLAGVLRSLAVAKTP